MHCETSFDSDPRHPLHSEAGSAITFADVEVNDKVLIRTRNSEYRFEIADPVNGKGLLSGGTVGEKPREAILIESLIKSDSGRLRDFRGLKTGARALFYLSSNHRIERVKTSNISSLILVKAADRTSLISSSRQA